MERRWRSSAARASRRGSPTRTIEAAGAELTGSAEPLGADIVLKVRRPGRVDLSHIKPGAVVIATMDPYGHQEAIDAMAKAGVSAFAMELMPRITRAQVMDVLSSQANLAATAPSSTRRPNMAAPSR